MTPPENTRTWLHTHGLDEFAPAFEQNRVTPDMLPTLTVDDLREMGITALGHRKKILAAIATLGAPGVLPPVGAGASSANPAPAIPAESIIMAAIPAESIVMPVIVDDAPRREASWSAVASDSATPLLQAHSANKSPQRTAKASDPAKRATKSAGSAPSANRQSANRPSPAPAKAVSPPLQGSATALQDAVAPNVAPSTSRKRKGFSGGFFTVSIALHLVLGLGAGYWVVQEIAAKRKLQFKGGPPTASPSKRAMEHKVSLQKKKNAGGAPAQAKRISVQGLASSITLPEMLAMPNASTQFVAGRMAGMGGAGFGTGLGFGNGSGMGVGGMGKGGLGLTMFGARGGGGLAGTFYDLKQTRDRQPSGVNAKTYNGVVRSWVAGGLKESVMAKYFQAPAKLYATQFVMPKMAATEAPKAYGVEKDVKPAQWVAHYKGKVSPPKSGTYQFIGAADDTLIVRFDGKLVLEGSWYLVANLKPQGIDPRGNYGGHPRKGYVKGEPFTVTAGQWYDIDVVIGEQPGGFFFACLCIEEVGGKDLPLFRLSSGKLPKLDNPPPFKDNGPIWRALSGTTSPLDMLKR